VFSKAILSSISCFKSYILSNSSDGFMLESKLSNSMPNFCLNSSMQTSISFNLSFVIVSNLSNSSGLFLAKTNNWSMFLLINAIYFWISLVKLEVSS